MQSKFPFSMENIPQAPSFFCLSLKFGAIVSSIVAILYSVLALAECGYALTQILSTAGVNNNEGLFIFTIVLVVTMSNVVTFVLSATLLVGIFKEKARWIKPWVVWISFLTIIYVITFVLGSTMALINNYGHESLLYYFVNFLTLIVRMYMLVTVSSHYKQVLSLNNMDEGYKIIAKEAWENYVT